MKKLKSLSIIKIDIEYIFYNIIFHDRIPERDDKIKCGLGRGFDIIFIIFTLDLKVFLITQDFIISIVIKFLGTFW